MSMSNGGGELTNNEECGERMDDLSNMLADAATEVLEGQFAEARTILDDIAKSMIDVNAYIALMDKTNTEETDD